MQASTTSTKIVNRKSSRAPCSIRKGLMQESWGWKPPPTGQNCYNCIYIIIMVYLTKSMHALVRSHAWCVCSRDYIIIVAN